MKAWIRIAALLSVMGTGAQAQGMDFTSLLTGAAADLTVGGLVDRFEGAGNDLISKAQNAGSAVAFVAGTQALTALSAFEATAGSLLNRSLKGLSTQQYDFFQNTALVLQRAQDGAQDSLFQAEGLINQAGNLAQLLPTVKQVAVVSSYRQVLAPPPPAAAPELALAFNGYGFGFGEATLNLGEVSFTARPSTSGRLEFLVPVMALTFGDDRLSYLTGTLILREPVPRTVGERIADALAGRKQSLRERAFDVRYVLLPRRLGTYAIEATYGTTKAVSETRTQFVGFNSDNAEQACTTANVQVRSPDRSILSNPTFTETSYNHGRGGVINLTAKGFQVEACASGHGRKLWGGRYEGYSHQRVNWVETWDAPVTEAFRKDATLDWNTEVPLDLPTSTEKWRLTFTTFEGKTLIADNAADLDYLSVGYNPATKLVVLRPRPFWGH
ncbi:hypothetical protein [Deinococcus yunweiensis]|uniref:hypothetical protein n=1 Tax=Deinococcus yunweiensis TaxID=367282 RepID=UPI00398F623B